MKPVFFSNFTYNILCITKTTAPEWGKISKIQNSAKHLQFLQNMVVLVLCCYKVHSHFSRFTLARKFFIETLNKTKWKEESCLSLQRPDNLLNSFNFNEVVDLHSSWDDFIAIHLRLRIPGSFAHHGELICIIRAPKC